MRPDRYDLSFDLSYFGSVPSESALSHTDFGDATTYDYPLPLAQESGTGLRWSSPLLRGSSYLFSVHDCECVARQQPCNTSLEWKAVNRVTAISIDMPSSTKELGPSCDFDSR